MVLSVGASADIYKWTDDSGKVHFGDRPKHDAGAQEVKVNANNIVSNDVLHLSGQPRSKALKSIDQIELERKLTRRANETKKRASCDADREFMEKLSGTDLIDGKVHFYYFKENGKAVSEGRKKEMIAELKEKLEKKHC